ncbi:MAG: carboxylating nicotinate-nucleotide diphosphorylase [Acidobacteriota bacterium]|nr:carboxylating nicotinate-nucleotide diphosphorylase [Acidobacteriota bacterium]
MTGFRTERVVPLPSRMHYDELLRRELALDLGVAGDVTTKALIPEQTTAKGRIVARGPGRVCGLRCALWAFDAVGSVTVTIENDDGADVEAGTVVAIVAGAAQTVLTAERTALNLLSHLSGVATATRDLVTVVATKGTARVVCTRKTTPGLRALEKYAVRVGGGWNHRFGLYDGVLIKDNHLVLAGGVTAAIAKIRATQGHMVKVEVEVDTLAQLDEALSAGADAVLLDNMTPADLELAVNRAEGRVITEASGGISAHTIGQVAATGIDIISVGWITHSAPALDFGLDVDPVI